jgi:hypothetical protein
MILVVIGLGARELISAGEESGETDVAAQARATFVSRANGICRDASREQRREERRLSGSNSSVVVLTVGLDNPLSALINLRRPPAIEQELNELFQTVDRVREASVAGASVESQRSRSDRVALERSLLRAQAAAAAGSQAFNDYGLTACPRAIGWPQPQRVR